MSMNAPRRFVDSSISAPMYVAGVTTLSLDPRLADLLDLADGRQRDGLSTRDRAAAVGQERPRTPRTARTR